LNKKSLGIAPSNQNAHRRKLPEKETPEEGNAQRKSFRREIFLGSRLLAGNAGRKVPSQEILLG
jgi:hypothetical protein